MEVILENSEDRLIIENCEGTPRSVHRFIVRDAMDLGCGGKHNLTADQACLILAISCSLTNPRVLFSPLQPYQFSASLKLDKVPSKVEVVDTPTGKHINITGTIRITGSVCTLLTTTLSLDESKIFNVINRLLTDRIFNKDSRSLPELNVLESLRRYIEALMSADRLSCYKSLYNAFEKAVNKYTDQQGKSFDAAASGLIGLPETDIERLRSFNNRIKHALRDKKDFNELKAGEAQLAQLALNLKKATDLSILSTI